MPPICATRNVQNSGGSKQSARTPAASEYREKSMAGQKRMIAVRPPDLCNLGYRLRDSPGRRPRLPRRHGATDGSDLAVGRDIAYTAAPRWSESTTAMDGHLTSVDNHACGGQQATLPSRNRGGPLNNVNRSGQDCPARRPDGWGRSGCLASKRLLRIVPGGVFEPSPEIEVAGLCARCSRHVYERSWRGR